MEMIGGSPVPAAVAIQKTRKGKVEEIVDPRLYYHEQPGFRREQMEAIADLATRCLLFGGGGGGGEAAVGKTGELGGVVPAVVGVVEEKGSLVGSHRGRENSDLVTFIQKNSILGLTVLVLTEIGIDLGFRKVRVFTKQRPIVVAF
ncbi:hypothetical protein LINPERPRIM_LOCUS9988 [Linum perenne]